MNSWRHIQTNKGTSLEELSEHGKVMLVFLRHFGCTFCREAMADLNEKRNEIESNDTTVVLVHQVGEGYAKQILEIYGLDDLHRVGDPNLELYGAFELERGSFKQMFGLRVWWRGFVAGVLKGHLVGAEKGDGWQMPGVFVVHKSKIIQKFKHHYASDRPDYVQLAACQIGNS